MKNKKGFIAVSIIFSFFIVFLLLLTINLTAYAQNRILLNQVKKDIKAKTLLKYKMSLCSIEKEMIDDNNTKIVRLTVNNTETSDDDKYSYSLDNITFNDTNTFEVTSNGTYQVYIKYKKNNNEKSGICSITVNEFTEIDFCQDIVN